MPPWRIRPDSLFAPLASELKPSCPPRSFLASELIGDASCLILILDLRMPGMDGLELQRHLANANHRVPIIFVSARANEGDRKQAIEKGAVDFLYKPFSEDALFKAIQLALSRSQDSK
jgi:FixJ family two-component response regulator